MNHYDARLAKRLAGAILCYLSINTGPALAQETTEQLTNGTLGPVIVTARKVRENLLDTPVTVTALTADDLATRNIDSMEDIAEFTPGLKLNAMSNSRNDRSNQTLIIRGMTPGSSSNVSVFIDGAPVVGSGFVSGFDDLARVEVLKGPQSATFGRATFAGAINLVTKDPAEYFHSSIDAQVMTHSGHDLRAVVEGPLLPDDRLGFRVEARDYSTAGTYRNAANPDETLGAQSTQSISLILKAKLSKNLTTRFLGNYWIDDDGVSPNYLITSRQYNCAAGAAGTKLNYTCGELPAPDLRYLADNDQIDTPVENAIFRGKGNQLYLPDMGPGFSNHMGLERRAYHLSNITVYDIPAIDASLTSNFSYDKDQYEETLDVDNQDTSNQPNSLYSASTVTTLQPFVNWPFYYQVSQSGYAEDLRLQGGDHERVHWSVGLSYVKESSSSVTGALLQSGPLNFQVPVQSITETDGVFGSIAYDILSNLTAIFEARYQKDHLTAEQFNAASHRFYSSVGADQTSFIPRVFLKYHPQPNWMIYTSYAEGVNPGGFNSNILQYTPAQQAALSAKFGANLEVKPEKLRSYELGVKGTFWGGRAQVTADVYRAIWSNQIVSDEVSISNVAGIPAGSLLGVSLNIGRTLLYGAEIEGQVIAARGLTINGGFGYTPSKIERFACLICQVSITGNPNVDGNHLPQAASVNLNLGAEYEHPITNSLDGDIRVDWVYQGKVYEDPTNLAWIAPTGHVNFHVGVIRGNVEVDAFVNNVFDNIGYTQVAMYENLIDNFSNDATPALPPRRTVGIRLRASM